MALRVGVAIYLGIFIDKKLLWDAHINHVINKQVLWNFLQNQTFFNYEKKCVHIIYGIELVANTYEKYLDPLVKLNNYEKYIFCTYSPTHNSWN